MTNFKKFAALALTSLFNPDLFALEVKRPDLLHERVAEVTGRLDAAGAEITPLDEPRLRADLR